MLATSHGPSPSGRSTRSNTRPVTPRPRGVTPWGVFFPLDSPGSRPDNDRPMGLSLPVGARRTAMTGLALILGVAAALPARAQSPPAVVRVALLPQWVIQQHRGIGGALSPELRSAVDGGVVDRTVF